MNKPDSVATAIEERIVGVRPLHTVLGVDWINADMFCLTEKNFRARLLDAPTLSEKQVFSAALNAVIRKMFGRRRFIRGVFTMAQVVEYYRATYIAGLGPVGRAMLNQLFEIAPAATPETTPAPVPARFRYPVFTFSGIAYLAPVRAGTSCEHCKHLAECRQFVNERDGFALCEDVLADEIIQEAVA